MGFSFRSAVLPRLAEPPGIGWKIHAGWYDARVRALGLFPLLLLAGCCSTFDRDFAAARTASEDASTLVGAWEGDWHSDPSGHAGALRCIVTRSEEGFRSRYHATFAFLLLPLSFEYEVPLTALQEGDTWRFRGSATIDYFIAGGLYEYEGLVQRDEFIASYRAGFDSGVFRMKRVRP